MKVGMIFLIVLFYSCSSPNTIVKVNDKERLQTFSQANTNSNINTPPVIKRIFYLDYDNFTDKLLSAVNHEYIIRNNIKNYIELIENNRTIYTRKWYISGNLKMIETFSSNNLILNQRFFINNEIVKKVFHYMDNRIIKINIYKSNILDGVIEYFYNDKNMLYKIRNYNEKYLPLTETHFTYNEKNKIKKETEFKINILIKTSEIIREYYAAYENDNLISEIEYKYNNKIQYKHIERFFDGNGKLKRGIIFSLKHRNNKLLQNDYVNNVLISSIAYYNNGRIKTLIKYIGNNEESRINYSQTGEIITSKCINNYFRIALADKY